MTSIYASTISSENFIIINNKTIELSGNIFMKKDVTINNGLLTTNSLIPNVTNSASLGSTSNSWSNAYISDLSVNNNLQVTGNVKISKNLDVSNIYTKSQVDASFTNVYTKAQIDASFANVYTRGEIDLSFANVYTKSHDDLSFANVYTKASSDASFANVYTKAYVDASFANVYTKEYVDASFANVYTKSQVDASLANVYTKSQIDASFSNVYTKTQVDASLANVYTKAFIDASFSNVYTKNLIDVSFANVYTKSQLDLSFGNVYTKNVVDVSFANVYTKNVVDVSFANVYTKAYVDASFANVYTKAFVDASFTNVYTKAYVDASFSNVYNKSQIDLSFANVYTKGQVDTSFLNVYTRSQLDVSFVSKQIYEASFNALAARTGGGTSTVLTSITTNVVPSVTNTYTLGDVSRNWSNAYIRDLKVSNRAYQEISGDISWSAVNGYYGLTKDAYPGLNPSSSGVKAVQSWTVNTQGVPSNCYWRDVCWSPELGIFVAVGDRNPNAYVIYSSNGIQWTSVSVDNNAWFCVEWSPQLRIFVALAMGGATTNRLMTSTNGKDWTMRTLPVNNRWVDVCWSPELGIFVATAELPGTSNLVMTSKNGIDWSLQTPSQSNSWYGICWSPELRIFVAVAGSGTSRVMISNNGINWQAIGLSQGVPNIFWISICWSPQLGLFVAVAAGWGGGNNNYIMTSQNGTTWTTINNSNYYAATGGICWSPQLKLFVAISYSLGRAVTSPDGITWIAATQSLGGDLCGVCWSPELGIFVTVGGTISSYSSLKGRPPTSYNVFDSSFNSIDETGKWTFANMAVSGTVTAGGSNVASDDRLKHNEVVIANGLAVIDKLRPKFYQKTFDMLDAHYNGDLSNHVWIYEAGLIAQEVLQSGEINFVVSGGDYYESVMNYDLSVNDLSVNDLSVYDLSVNDLSVNDLSGVDLSYALRSANYYEVSNNLIKQPYALNYNSIFTYGVAAIKELHTKVKAQEANILDQQLNSLITRIETLETQASIPNNEA